MAKKISLSLCLFLGVIVNGIPAQATITKAPTVSQSPLSAQSGIAPTLLQLVAQQAAPAQPATLTLEDLPPGFTELPPELAAKIASRLEVLREQMGQGNMKPENFFAFVNPKTFQVVLGFTGKFPNEAQQTSFDTNLQQLHQPEAQERTLSLLQENLKAFGSIKVTEYRALPELNNLANASTGIALALEMHNQPLRLDLAAFRRNSMGAFTGVMYANGQQPVIAVADVAQKLDHRLEQLSSDFRF
ncbi:MAG: hypothetical protein AB1589_06155 [Cyanobacteriota bacterium]